jgi:predicted AAA+ superfamily ATPase
MVIERNLAVPLVQLASQMPVVAVTGPRQSGKTTLCRHTFPDKPFVSLEPLDNRRFASDDPRGFLREYADGAVLDEVQRVPELFSYLQAEVDERPEPGRFILTGSQHFGLTEAITQSLAGRIAILHLLPPSLDELARFQPPPTDLWQLIWAGAYPRIYDLGLDAGRWLADYTATYLQRDVRQVLNVTDLEAFATFLELAAGRTGGELNLSRLAGDAGVTHPTVRAWLSVLEASFLTLRLPAWHHSPRKQVVKTPKLHFLDTGLACHLLGIMEPGQLLRHPLRGALFESWVVSEVYKWRLHRGLPARMFHYRESRGVEIDLLVTSGDRLLAVEAKSGATVAGDFFTSLLRFTAEAEERDPHLAHEARLVYGGDVGQRRSRATLIPWHALHEHAW